jgi:hypothetical protein
MAAAVMLTSGCGTAGQSAVVHVAPAASSAGAATSGRALTSNGNLLERFEGLLHSTFGSKQVCERAKAGPAVFVANGCSPLATYEPYLDTFEHPTNTILRLSHREPRDFGNYPRVILINGETVRCNTGKHPKYLITYADTASFSLSCQTPQ